ncbi:MAG: hypothetical protein ABEN55_03720, partial [Bradymonadaceae bacterium]
RRIALAALGRTALKRLRDQDGEPGPEIHFSLLRSQPGPDLLSMPVVDALDGTSYSLRDLEEMMDQTAGLVYGAVPEVEPNLEGLDRSRILDLDLERERQLLTILGEGAYVRIDQRDVLAETGDHQVRDMAIGLRSYPDFPLLVEGADPTDLDEQARETLVEKLVANLKSTYLADLKPSIKREAVRHLQWFVCQRTLAAPEAPTYGVEQLPLFLDGHGNQLDFRQVRRGLQSDEGVEMIDGRSSDVCELGSLTGEELTRSQASKASHLMMNTWVYRLLSAHGGVRGAFEFNFTDDEAADIDPSPDDAFLQKRTVDTEAFSGQIGVPLRSVSTPTVAVVDNQKRSYRMHDPSTTYGVTGFLQIEHGDVREHWSDLQSRVALEGRKLLTALSNEIPELDPDDDRFRRAFEALFGFAARHLQMTREPDGTVRPQIEHPLAQKIFELPLFPTQIGNPVSALRLIREFCLAQSTDGLDERVPLNDDPPEHLQLWLDRHLTLENVVAPAESKPRPTDDADAPETLADRLAHWLGKLRPDDGPETPANADGLDVGQQYQTRVYLADAPDAPDVPVEFGADQVCKYLDDVPNGEVFSTLLLNPDHPYVHEATSDPRAFAWLLLRAYADINHINDVLEPVTNDHELEFQRRVADSLDAM